LLVRNKFGDLGVSSGMWPIRLGCWWTAIRAQTWWGRRIRPSLESRARPAIQRPPGPIDAEAGPAAPAAMRVRASCSRPSQARWWSVAGARYSSGAQLGILPTGTPALAQVRAPEHRSAARPAVDELRG
jgi:hypothetical protein